MAKNKSELASVLAFEKKLVPSDGYMYSTKWSDRACETPVHITEKAVRGTISNRLKADIINDPAKLNAKIQNANPQTVDHAALCPGDDTLKVQFTLKVLPHAWIPSACNDPEHYRKIIEFGESYAKATGFQELAGRYAMNIANGRFLWRNRVGAEDIEIAICDEADQKKWEFNAYDYSLKDFDGDHPEISEMAGLIADALCGKREYLLLEVTAHVKMGKGQDVYPSEEMVLDKGNKTKSKILYQVNETAALHSQKIGNAIRTIDTWYPDEDDSGLGPIAVEPYGAVTNLGRAFRNPKDKVDFYTLFDSWSRGTEPATAEKKHYVMAVLVRGGVFGDSGKE